MLAVSDGEHIEDDSVILGRGTKKLSLTWQGFSYFYLQRIHGKERKCYKFHS